MQPSLELTELLKWDSNLLELQVCSSIPGSKVFLSLGKTIALIPSQKKNPLLLKKIHSFCEEKPGWMLQSWVKAPADVNLFTRRAEESFSSAQPTHMTEKKCDR